MTAATREIPGSSAGVFVPEEEPAYGATLLWRIGSNILGRIEAAPKPGLTVQLSTGSASLTTVVSDPVDEASSARGREYLVLGGRGVGTPLSIDPTNRKWLKLRWAHFPREGREARVQRALAAIESAVAAFGLDAATLREIAEDPDLEGC